MDSAAHASPRNVVAIIDDEPLVLRALHRILAPCGHEIVTATRADALPELLVEPRLCVVLLDLFVGEASGLDGLELARRERRDVEVVVMTGRGSIESAVSCMRAGAFDYLCKPFSEIERVREAVRAARSQAIGDVTPRQGARPARPQATPLASDWLRVPLVQPDPGATDVPLSLEAYERLALERALREAAGDASEAARRLGIGRSTFYRRAAKLGVELRGYDELSGGTDRPTRVGRGPAIG